MTGDGLDRAYEAGSRADGYSMRRAGVTYASLSLLRPIANLAALPVLVLTLPSSEFGLFVLLIPVWWICQALLTLGGNEAIGRIASAEVKGVEGAVVLLSAAAVLLGTLLGILLTTASENVLGVAADVAIGLAVAVGVAQATTATAASVLRSQLWVARASVVVGASTIIPIAIGLLTVSLGESSARSYYAGHLVGGVAVSALGLGLVLRGSERPFSGSLAAFRTSLRLGIPLMPQLLSALVLELAIRRYVTQVAGLEAVGVYGLGFAVGNVSSVLVKAGIQAWAPAFFRAPRGEVVSHLKVMAVPLLVGCLGFQGVVMLMYVAAQPILEQRGLEPTSFALVAFIAALAGPASVILLGTIHLGLHHHRTTHAWWVVLLAGIVTLLAAVAGGRHLGWEIVASATPASALLASVLYWMADRKLPITEFVRGTVASLFLAIVAATVGLIAVVQFGSTLHATVAGAALIASCAWSVLYVRARRSPE